MKKKPLIFKLKNKKLKEYDKVYYIIKLITPSMNSNHYPNYYKSLGDKFTQIIPDGTLLKVTIQKHPIRGKYALSQEILNHGLLNKPNTIIKVCDHRIYNYLINGKKIYWSMIAVKPVNINCPVITIYTNRDVITTLKYT